MCDSAVTLVRYNGQTCRATLSTNRGVQPTLWRTCSQHVAYSHSIPISVKASLYSKCFIQFPTTLSFKPSRTIRVRISLDKVCQIFRLIYLGTRFEEMLYMGTRYHVFGNFTGIRVGIWFKETQNYDMTISYSKRKLIPRVSTHTSSER